jgi:hypothetical protein
VASLRLKLIAKSIISRMVMPEYLLVNIGIFVKVRWILGQEAKAL